jgi:aldehyde:ferredoxin oxidoreductase
MAWQRKVLRVNLTTRTCTPEPLNMQWAQDYLGQRGLATKYFCEEVDPKVDPLSPANKLLFATGPLTGTMASTSARYSVITKGPLTGAIACSNSGGYFGAELRFAGWDMIVIEGKADDPVYLHIENDKATLRPADDIWGKSVWETEAILKKKHQDPLIRVSSIGRAGEAQVLFAAIVNDLHRAAGRSGVGAVMGSKNLKAIAVRGTVGVGKVADPAAFMKATVAAKKVLADNAVTGQGLPKFGTQVLMNVINEMGALPTRNHRDVQFERAGKISAEAMHEKRPTDGKANLVTNQACFGCTIACGRISKIDETHYTVVNKPQYWGASGGLEYEAAWALGAATGVGDLEALTYANFVCNEDGIDPISFGATVGAAMELYDLGLIKESEVGFPLTFGSPEVLTKLTEMTCRGEGFGKEIGQGSKRLCSKYGRPELSMSVKGQEFPAYDSRGIQGMGLAYATANRGACHLRGYTVRLRGPWHSGQDRSACHRGQGGAGQGVSGCDRGVRLVGAVPVHLVRMDACRRATAVAGGVRGRLVDGEISARRRAIWNLERQFNNAAGFTAKDDNLPPRLTSEPAKSGPAKGLVNGLDKMLPEYYQLRGWSKDGVPTPETVERLGL